jgi:hypothetical protein
MNRRVFLLTSGMSVAGILGCESRPMFQDYECFWCKGAGTIRCTDCFGKGVSMRFDSGMQFGSSSACTTCGASGNMRCPTCDGKGKLSNNPTAR